MAVHKLTDTKIRDKDADARKILISGMDPMEEKRQRKSRRKVEEGSASKALSVAENTFRAVEAKWFEHWNADNSPRHIR